MWRWLEFESLVVEHLFRDGWRLFRAGWQRITDWRRERRIRALRARVVSACDAGENDRACRLARELFAECDARSPAQLARMEQARDPHEQAVGP